MIGHQLLRSGTSVGANCRAACRARSTAEFVAKLGVVEEEADEAGYWMELLNIPPWVHSEFRICKGAAVSNDRLRAFYEERRRKGPGLIALAIVGIINWIVSDVLNFSSLVSQLNIDMSGFKHVANVLLPEFGLFGSLFIVALICWLLDWDRLTHAIFFVANGIATFLVANYAFDLLFSLTKRSGNRDAAFLLIDAVLVWLMNLIVFTLWYWMLDRGGPDRRGTPRERRRDWLFPQDQSSVEGWEHWKPGFTDYLYAAFAYSASFGPNDTQMLSQRFKVLSMAQTLLSLMVVVMIAARAINLFTA